MTYLAVKFFTLPNANRKGMTETNKTNSSTAATTTVARAGALVTELAGLLAACKNGSADAEWMLDPRNGGIIEDLRHVLRAKRTCKEVSFKDGTYASTDVATDVVRAWYKRLFADLKVGKKFAEKYNTLASITLAGHFAGPLSLFANEEVRAIGLPVKVSKAVFDKVDDIEWCTPDGDPHDDWNLFTCVDDATTPSYDARRRELWSRILDWRLTHGAVRTPARETLATYGATSVSGAGGAAPTVTRRVWNYGTEQSAVVPEFPAPVPRNKLNLSAISDALPGHAHGRNLGVYYVFVDPTDMPEAAPNVDRVQIYVGKATPNVHFRIFDTMGHWGAIDDLAKLASCGGRPALPRGALLVDVALLWAAIKNGGSWQGCAAVVIAANVADDAAVLRRHEVAHIATWKARDMHFGMNGTKGG